MAKELCTLEKCLVLTQHHVAPHKFNLMLHAGAPLLDFKDRFALVHQNLMAALVQVNKIREAAKHSNCVEVLKLLDEESIPAGHEF